MEFNRNKYKKLNFAFKSVEGQERGEPGLVQRTKKALWVFY